MSFPRIVIHTDRIKENAKTISELARKDGISITGVTKATCGNVHVAKAMLEGGVNGFADSRVKNLRNLRNYFGHDVTLLLLRLPMLSKVEEVVETADASLNSEVRVIEALSNAAEKLGKRHGIMLMVDLGDLREGLLPDKVLETARFIEKLPGVYLQGLGTNLTCYGGILPTEENLGQLVEIAQDIQKDLGKQLCYISGGNSSSLHLLGTGIPHGINHLRVGETILIGNDTALSEPFPGTRADTFVLQAEIIEAQVKPSVPTGKVGVDAFGRIPKKPEDRGLRRRGILAVGEQDIQQDGLTPLDPGVDILGSSSDHLLVDITDNPDELRIGDYLSFTVDYGNLLRAMTSPYVHKIVL